jgi:tyrosyl-tRNA synthetase
MVNLDENPDEMYGKVMSWPDGLVIPALELCTMVSTEKIAEVKVMANPRDQKVFLAKEIVRMYHGQAQADKAEAEFDRVHRGGEIPTEIEVFETDRKTYGGADLLCDTKLAPSKKEAKRLVEGGAVSTRINNQETKLSDWNQEINLENDMVVQVGKRRFIKIKLK